MDASPGQGRAPKVSSPCPCHHYISSYPSCILEDHNLKSVVPVKQIRELRLGQPPNDVALTSSRWITIVYVRGKEWKILHMISLTDDVHDYWVGTLRTLVSETSDRAVAEIKPSDPDLIWIRQLWPAGSRAIDMSTALGLCRSIGLEVPMALQNGYKVSSSCRHCLQ